MRFIVDENLPPRVAAWLCERGHDAVHVQRAALVGRKDSEVAERALAEGRVIVTKDKDFSGADFSGGPLQIMRLGVGNVRTAELLAWLEPRLAQAEERLRNGGGDVLVA